MTRILALDTDLFLWIQHSLVGSTALDEVFVAISRYSLVFFAAVMGFLLVYLIAIKKRSWLKNVMLLLTATAIPITISYYARPLIGRPRPFLVLDFEPLLTTGTVSFPSNHATAAFAVAMAVFACNRKAGAVLMVPAVLTAFSRVYVGVHYPLDVIAGGLLGIILVWAVTSLPRLFGRKKVAA